MRRWLVVSHPSPDRELVSGHMALILALLANHLSTGQSSATGDCKGQPPPHPSPPPPPLPPPPPPVPPVATPIAPAAATAATAPAPRVDRIPASEPPQSPQARQRPFSRPRGACVRLVGGCRDWLRAGGRRAAAGDAGRQWSLGRRRGRSC